MNMSYEAKLAAMLGAIPNSQKEKLAAEFESMSIEELNELTVQDGASFLDEAAYEAAQREKIAMADSWGRELARMEKTAIPMPNMKAVGGALKSFGGAAKGIAGQGMLATQQMGAGARAGVGAVGGAALGAAKGMVAPGTDANGQKRSRLSAMASGAAGGAALGAGAGLASKGAVRAVGTMKNSVGAGARDVMQSGINRARTNMGSMPANIRSDPRAMGIANKVVSKADSQLSAMRSVAGEGPRAGLGQAAQKVAKNPTHGQNYVPGTSNTSPIPAGTPPRTDIAPSMGETLQSVRARS